MALSPSSLLAYSRTPEGLKKVRFGLVSAIAIVVSMVCLFVCYYAFRWESKHSIKGQGVAFIVSTVASFVLNRRWVWGKSGKSSFKSEIVPFWGIGLLQLAISIPFVQWGVSVFERHFADKEVRTFMFLLLNLVVYGVMWVGKFMFFEKFLFADKTSNKTTDKDKVAIAATQ